MAILTHRRPSLSRGPVDIAASDDVARQMQPDCEDLPDLQDHRTTFVGLDELCLKTLATTTYKQEWLCWSAVARAQQQTIFEGGDCDSNLTVCCDVVARAHTTTNNSY